MAKEYIHYTNDQLLELVRGDVRRTHGWQAGRIGVQPEGSPAVAGRVIPEGARVVIEIDLPDKKKGDRDAPL